MSQIIFDEPIRPVELEASALCKRRTTLHSARLAPAEPLCAPVALAPRAARWQQESLLHDCMGSPYHRCRATPVRAITQDEIPRSRRTAVPPSRIPPHSAPLSLPVNNLLCNLCLHLLKPDGCMDGTVHLTLGRYLSRFCHL